MLQHLCSFFVQFLMNEMNVLFQSSTEFQELLVYKKLHNLYYKLLFSEFDCSRQEDLINGVEHIHSFTSNNYRHYRHKNIYTCMMLSKTIVKIQQFVTYYTLRHCSTTFVTIYQTLVTVTTEQH